MKWSSGNVFVDLELSDPNERRLRVQLAAVRLNALFARVPIRKDEAPAQWKEASEATERA